MQAAVNLKKMLSALGGPELACTLLKEFPTFVDTIKIKVFYFFLFRMVCIAILILREVIFGVFNQINCYLIKLLTILNVHNGIC